MEQVPKDVRIKILMELKPEDIINFCLTEKKQAREICNNYTFWFRKLEKDYPGELLEYYQAQLDGVDMKIDPKALYIARFKEFSSLIESFVETFISTYIGTFSKYLTDEYRQDLYKQYIQLMEEIAEYEELFELGEISEERYHDGVASLVFKSMEKFIPDAMDFTEVYATKPIQLVKNQFQSLRMKEAVWLQRAKRQAELVAKLHK